MSKTRIKYVCSNCAYESLKWLGRCPECEEWNTFTEELVESRKSSAAKGSAMPEISRLENEISHKEERIQTGIQEFDRVLGGGITAGSVILIGGDPGIGKSTLVMQVADKLKREVLYVTGEESLNQIKSRAKRLQVKGEYLSLLAEVNLDIILKAIEVTNPALVIVDSIQTLYKSDLDNSPGTITQIRECTSDLMAVAKTKNIAVIVIGHVTKEGYIAGPKVLEHIVDTVVQFEGEKNHDYRILRAQKNRFGSTNEIGIFEMSRSGLIEVTNPSELFLSEREVDSAGSVVTACMEGTRPVLLEVQALVTPSHFGNPQRVATGFDYRRLSILLAVVEKRSGMRLSAHNVFLNMAGGLKVDEPAADLAVCSSIVSSLTNKPVKNDTMVIGEVGLGGEIRSVNSIEKRIDEAAKLGFRCALIPKHNLKSIRSDRGIEIIPVASITAAFENILADTVSVNHPLSS